LVVDTTRQLQLPSDLCEAAEKKIAGHFGTLEEFLTFILAEFVRDDASTMDINEQRIIEERLRDLGYI
jgi:hypothetical protein